MRRERVAAAVWALSIELGLIVGLVALFALACAGVLALGYCLGTVLT